MSSALVVLVVLQGLAVGFVGMVVYLDCRRRRRVVVLLDWRQFMADLEAAEQGPE